MTFLRQKKPFSGTSSCQKLLISEIDLALAQKLV
jgi:hypothetical protein